MLPPSEIAHLPEAPQNARENWGSISNDGLGEQVLAQRWWSGPVTVVDWNRSSVRNFSEAKCDAANAVSFTSSIEPSAALRTLDSDSSSRLFRTRSPPRSVHFA